VVINTVVISAHILTANDYDFLDSVSVVFHSLAISAAFFVAVCVALLFTTIILKKTSKEKTFWMLMIVGITVTVLLFMESGRLYAGFNDEPVMIASISAFSILVSLTAQYELLTDENFKGSFHIDVD